MNTFSGLVFQASWRLIVAVTVPEPGGDPPEKVQEKVKLFLGWLRYGGMAAGVGGLIVCGAMMAAGQRNRHSLSADGAAGVPWALAGVSPVILASSIVTQFA
ncbi:hypothetical protein MXD61_08910 [Frankia sp. AgPm24]|uniref:hypothetical protein n=1 Tax=Frankia sp. AgPm24 TaxID=631128 RepID=UPI00200EB471|nr:hypothetical protein [Frankia sp. AgPm24]MCK9922001.1 hypothetical protein [Frankia sp. AgPm24]